MKSSDSGVILVFVITVVAVVAIATSLLMGNVPEMYLNHRSFQIAYESSMSCRASVASNRDLNAYQHVDKICKEPPSLSDLKSILSK